MANEELLKSIEQLLDNKLEPIKKELNVNSSAILKLEQKIDAVFDIHTITVETNKIVKEIKIRVDSLETKVFAHESTLKKHFSKAV